MLLGHNDTKLHRVHINNVYWHGNKGLSPLTRRQHSVKSINNLESVSMYAFSQEKKFIWKNICKILAEHSSLSNNMGFFCPNSPKDTWKCSLSLFFIFFFLIQPKDQIW